jgi:hypothetical protein
METIVYIILLGFIAVGIVLLVISKKKNSESTVEKPVAKEVDPYCCGAHEVCELDRIKMNPDAIEYFDDEELDEYKNIDENSYSDAQIDKFREVLYSMQPKEIPFWLVSLSKRHINLPPILQEEARHLILND